MFEPNFVHTLQQMMGQLFIAVIAVSPLSNSTQQLRPLPRHPMTLEVPSIRRSPATKRRWRSLKACSWDGRGGNARELMDFMLKDAESNRIHPIFFLTINGLYKAWTYGWFMSDLLILLRLVDIYMVCSLCIGWYLIGCGYVYFIFDIFEQWSCQDGSASGRRRGAEGGRRGRILARRPWDESWCWKIPKSPMKHLIETVVW